MTTTRGLRDREDPITMLTAYDAPTAAVVDEAGIDIVLVGDSMGNAVLGYDSTLPVTMAEVKSRTAAVARATEDALVVADMPFLSFGVEESESVRNAGELLKEADADAVKIESGPHTVETTRRMTDVGIPVMAHLGLTPQHVNRLGGYARQGTEQDAAEEIVELAGAHADAGAFALVLEHVPANLAGAVTEALDSDDRDRRRPRLRRTGARDQRRGGARGVGAALLRAVRRRPRRDDPSGRGV